MKSNYYLIVFSITLLMAIYQNINAQSPDWVWAKSIVGINAADGVTAESVAVDAYGNVYTAGSFSGTIDFDPGAGIFNLTSTGLPFEVFISKLDSAGNFVWAKALNSSNESFGWAITLDVLGNVYTTGQFTGAVDFDPGVGSFILSSTGASDIFISKLDSAGNFVWAKTMGGTGNNNDRGSSIIIDYFGNVYTTGYFEGTSDFNPDSLASFNLSSSGDEDIFISKLDSLGNFIWAKKLGGVDFDSGSSITLDAFNNVYTTGSFQSTADFDPGTAFYNLTAIGTSQNDFISKLDSAGNFVWAKAMGGTSGGQGITFDTYSNVYSTGFFVGTVDFNPGPGTFNLTSNGNLEIFISKLDSSGIFKWAKAIGGVTYDAGWAIAHDTHGNVYTTGVFSGTVDFDPNIGTFTLTSSSTLTGGYNIFVSKLDSLGNFVWAKSAGGTLEDQGLSIFLDAFGNGYISGSMGSPSIIFGSTTLTNTNGTSNNTFTAKLGNSITGIESIEQINGTSIYPNPISDKLTITLNNKESLEIILYDIASRKLLQQKFTNSVSLNTEQLSKGLYLYEVWSKNGLCKKGKVVKD